MDDDESGEDDPWFEGLTDTDAEDSESPETSVEDADQPVQSTDQWEWVGAEESKSSRDAEPEDEERVWSQFGSEKTDTGSGKDAARPEQGADDETDEHLSPESNGPGSADVPPPPPTARGQPADADAPPGPTRQDIQEMQPVYHRRTTEFFLLWLAAGLAYGLGDILTTSVVFITPRIGESNPFVAVILNQYGLAGFISLKLVVFTVLLIISIKGAIDDDNLSYYGPPLLAILVGTALTVWNLKTILGL
jgi:hypothetical protein